MEGCFGAAGPRGRPVVIALHASGSHGGQWDALRSLLEPHAQLVTPDLHGHGSSAGSSANWRDDDKHVVARDVAKVADLAARSGGRVHLVGHSYGGAIAMRVAARQPRSVISLAVYEPVEFAVLVEFNPKVRAVAEIMEVGTMIRRRIVSGDGGAAAAHFVDYWSGAGAWGALQAGHRADITARMNVVAAQFVDLLRSGPRLAEYRALRAPTLILTGEHTRLPVRRIAELLRFAVPGAVACTLPKLGHMGPITHPDIVARVVAAFVTEHAVPQSTRAHLLAA